MATANSRKLAGPLLVLLSSLCFGTTGTLQALAPEGATPFVITFVRMGVGALALLALALACGRFPADWRVLPWKRFAACALFVLGGQIFFLFGLLKLGVAVGTVIDIGATPVCAALIAWATGRGRPRPAWYLATAIAIAGIVLINGWSSESVSHLWYFALPLTGGFCYAAYMAAMQRVPETVPPEVATGCTMLIVMAIVMPSLFVFPCRWLVTPHGALVAAGFGIITSGCAFGFLTAGLRRTSSAVAATLCLAEPLTAACFGIFLLGEPADASTMAGLALVFGAIGMLLADELRHKPA